MSDPDSEPNTATGDGANTTAVPTDLQASAADLAWSVADTAPDVETPADSRRPLPKTLLAFLAGVGVAAVALSAFLLGEHEREQVDTTPTPPPSTARPPTTSIATASPPSAAPQPTSATSIAPPAPTPASPPSAVAPPATAAPSPSAPHPLSPDDTFFAQLQADGITFSSQARALRVAREVCLEFDLGVPRADIAAAVKIDNPSLPDTRAADFVSLSVNTYCPHHNEN